MNTAAVNIETNPDFTVIKGRQQATWSTGDYGRIGVTLQLTGEQLCEELDLPAGSRVLDVAAGNGNATLAAARRGYEVTSTDYVPELLQQGAERAQAEGLQIAFQPADAEALPFADESFDAVLSTFGVMFTPNQPLAASELLRVCRPGGAIGLANWTPTSFIGRLFQTIGKHVPPPPGVASPAAWGTHEFVDTHLAPGARSVNVETRTFMFRYRSAKEWLDVFGTWYGPTVKAFENAPDPDALRADVLALIDAFNTATDGSMRVPSDYLEIIVRR